MLIKIENLIFYNNQMKFGICVNHSNNSPKKYYPSSHIIDTKFDLREGDMFPRDT